MELSTVLEEHAVSMQGGLSPLQPKSSSRTMTVYAPQSADQGCENSTTIKAFLNKNGALIQSCLGIVGLICVTACYCWVGFVWAAGGSHEPDQESSLWSAESMPNLSMTSPFLGYRCVEVCGSVGNRCATIKTSPCWVNYGGCCCDNVYPCLEQVPGELYGSYVCVNHTVACGNILSQKCADRGQDPCADEYNGKCCAGFNLCRDYQAGTYICQRYI
eukprot:TRINITY_DN10956_c0_g2_i1.p1 TRINITY_DN10956_c0_g2~~TRINITY_DN10956_c0_g2_i1.p1  ORF type:complete len:217 (-),score=5.46 TRINITY_DN10956_c0_g2_i1:126-776(-)